MGILYPINSLHHFITTRGTTQRRNSRSLPSSSVRIEARSSHQHRDSQGVQTDSPTQQARLGIDEANCPGDYDISSRHVCGLAHGHAVVRLVPDQPSGRDQRLVLALLGFHHSHYWYYFHLLLAKT